MTTVRKEIRIDATSAAVWNVRSDFGSPHTWAPEVKHAVLLGGIDRGEGCERSCAVSGLGTITERAIAWKEGEGFELAIEGAPMMSKVRSTWAIRAEGGVSVVRAEVEYETRYGLLGAMIGVSLMRLMMSRTLGRTVRGLKQYVESGGAAEAGEASAA